MKSVLELSPDAVAQISVPEKPRLAEELVSFVSPWSFEADQYRALRHRVEAERERGVKVVAITSPAAGEGKTVTALNLAGAMAQSPDANVLLIDADFRRPALDRYLKLAKTRQPGLAAALMRGDGAVSGLARRIEALNLSVIPAGKSQARSYDLISSGHMRRLLDEAREQFDYVIIDAPPLLPLPDARAIEREVDGFVLVVAAHTTHRNAAAEALKMISASKLIALAFNGDNRRLPRSYRYYDASRSSSE